MSIILSKNEQTDARGRHKYLHVNECLKLEEFIQPQLLLLQQNWHEILNELAAHTIPIMLINGTLTIAARGGVSMEMYYKKMEILGLIHQFMFDRKQLNQVKRIIIQNDLINEDVNA